MQTPVMSSRRSPSPPWEHDLEPSAYLTDGARLFRVISSFSDPPAESFAVLEDCTSLKLSSHSPDELWAMGLRLVRS